MSIETPLELSLPIDFDKIVMLPACQAPAPPQPEHPLDPAQIRAAEALFAARQHESDLVIGLLGLWTGTMLLNDLAVETFSEPAGEPDPDEEKPKPKR